MMTEKYPTWLIGHVKEWAEKRLPTVILCSTTGNELLEVWYYGDLLTVKGEPQSYIIDSDEAPGLVTARDPESGEEFVIFDDIRPVYCGVQMVIFRVICVGKSRFSVVSVWFWEILLSWCYHTIYYQKNNALHYQILPIVMYHFQFQFSLCFSSTNNTSD